MHEGQNPPVSRRVLMVGTTGIEPVTPSMSTRCSPAELRAQMLYLDLGVLPPKGALGKEGDWRVVYKIHLFTQGTKFEHQQNNN